MEPRRRSRPSGAGRPGRKFVADEVGADFTLAKRVGILYRPVEKDPDYGTPNGHAFVIHNGYIYMFYGAGPSDPPKRINVVKAPIQATNEHSIPHVQQRVSRLCQWSVRFPQNHDGQVLESGKQMPVFTLTGRNLNTRFRPIAGNQPVVTP